MYLSHSEALSLIKETRLIAILRKVPQDKIDGVVSALIRGGVRVLEFTFDHDSPDYISENAAKIHYAAEKYGSDLLLGCGTTMNTDEVSAAYDAGARLVISPNVCKEVITEAKRKGMVSMPGALTPTEIVSAYDFGADIVKLFPAGELGLGYIKAVRGPLAYIPMSAVGGVNPENVPGFLNAGICGFGVGSPLVVPSAVKNGDFAIIEEKAKAFTSAIEDWKKEHEV